VAKTVGLAQPIPLRRPTKGAPLVSGTILILGKSQAANAIAKQLWEEEYDVRRDPGLTQRFSAIMMSLEEVQSPSDLSQRVFETGTALRRLEANGRVISTLPDPNESTVATDASATATRHSVEGFTRSLGKEMRRGATTNGIVLADGVDMDSAPAQ